MPFAHFVFAALSPARWNLRRQDDNLASEMPDDQESIGSVTTPPPGADVPQFSTAEYSHIPGTERCRLCGYPVSGEYFRINSQMACSKCAIALRSGQPSDSHAMFLRGLLMGAGAAVIGLVLYATFTIITNLYLGYIALGVGWLVGKAMMTGSHGMGGKRYQIAAVALTYFAISVAAVPIWIAMAIKHPAHPTTQTRPDSGADADASNPSDASPPPAQTHARPGMVKFLVQALFIGLASPFLQLRDPIHGLIGLVILFIGLRIAYTMTAAKPLEVDGPYPVTA
jgi:hypothetical protein